jgi:hypothetical protein
VLLGSSPASCGYQRTINANPPVAVAGCTISKAKEIHGVSACSVMTLWFIDLRIL